MLILSRRAVLFAFSLITVAFCSRYVAAQDGANCPPDGPRWHSEAWWAQHSQDPVGARQVEYKGKLWPPYPRPVGPKQAFCHIYHAEHYWPWPYQCIDRHVVLDMSRIQESNGWLTEATLYDYHFNPETNELTGPGKLHLKWILNYVPANYRTVWLQNVEDQGIAQQRLNNVRLVASRYVGEANLPPIAYRISEPPARPAIEIDVIRRAELGSMPLPRIPFPSSAGGAASTQVGTGQGP